MYLDLDFDESLISVKTQVQESAQLRSIRKIIDSMGIEEAKCEVLKQPSPKLWKILGEAALEVLNLDIAEECFIHCKGWMSN